MTKARQSFFVGAIVLVICGLITKFLGAIYKIPLLKILQSDGLGNYQMVFSIYSFFWVFVCSGIVITLSKLVSKQVLFHNAHNQKKYLKVGLLFCACSATIFATILVLIAPSISAYQGSSMLRMCYFAIAPALLLGGMASALRGYFLGKKQMILSGGAQVVEAVFKLVFGLFLAQKFLSHGTLGAVFGAVLAVSISEAFSLAFLALSYWLSRQKTFIASKIAKKIAIRPATSFCKSKFFAKSRYKTSLQAFKEIFHISFLITSQACILPLVSAIDGLVVVPLLAKTGMSKSICYSLFGLEVGIVSSLIALPTVVANSVGSAIIPNIKGADCQNASTKADIQNAIKIVWLVSIFCALVFVIFAKDIIWLLYSNGLGADKIDELKITADLLRIGGFNVVYLSLLDISISILQGLERSDVPVKNLLVALAVRYVVLFVCVPNRSVNIYGVAFCDMAFYATAMMLNVVKIKALTSLKFGATNMFLLPAICCAGACVCALMVQHALSAILSAKLVCILSIGTGFVIYVILLVATRVLNVRDTLRALAKKSQRA